MEGRKKMAEIKLVKKYPNIRDEDVTEIFQEGYLKGFENGRKYAIPIEWLINYEIKNGQETRLQEAITQWEKENE